MTRYASWLAAILGLAYFGANAWHRPDKPGAMRIAEFGRLPVVDGGRVKPIDTFARVSLQIISNRQELKDDRDRSVPTRSATRWLLDVWSNADMFQGPASKHRVFRIDSDQVLNFLKLDARPGSFRYSIAELEPMYPALVQKFWEVRKIDRKNRSLFQEKVFEIGSHLSLYEDIVRRRSPLVIPPSTETGGEWLAIAKLIEPFRRDYMQGLAEEMRRRGMKPEEMSWQQIAGIEAKIDEMSFARLPQLNPTAAAFVRLADRYRADDANGFNDALADYRSLTAATSGEIDSKAKFEEFVNQLAPFYHCAVLYVILAVLASCSWLGLTGPLSHAALGLGTLTFAAHTASLIARMYIQGRPPVTNLYSSAIFIGWGSAGLALLLERVYRNGVAAMVAGVTGASSLIIAHFLGQSGDTLEMMQAVLDTNFWLATHVTAVTLGYTASFVAGFIALFYVIAGVATPWLSKSLAKTTSGMIYGVVCFATLLSFVGTVLGGIWADQSWGRFWGWDPKENGALLIVIWNALILHARWAGLVKQRGIALLAIFGNIVTCWSWFGTNQLGVGLHSYGFTSGTSTTLVMFDVAMLAIIAMGLMPPRLWSSFDALNGTESASAPSAIRKSGTVS